MRYAESERAPAQRSTDGGATVHRVEIAARGHAPAADTLDASLNRSSRSQSLVQLQQVLDGSPRVQALQGLGHALNATHALEDEEAEQLPQDARPAAMQFAALPGDARKPDDPPPTPLQKKPNATGLPDRLKAGVESLSGLALDDVRVHYNSSKPAAVQAHAYAQGSDIHLAPGQEKHLPHEAWHVVQQKQGRVKPTLQMKGIAINDDAGLEREADLMGRQGTVPHDGMRRRSIPLSASANAAHGPVQMSESESKTAQIQTADSTLLAEMKKAHDLVYEPIPATYGNRLAILGDVAVGAARLNRLNTNKQGVDTLWNQWQTACTSKNQQDYPHGHNLQDDHKAMKDHSEAFLELLPWLTDKLPRVKKALVREHYFKTDTFQGVHQACTKDYDETLDHFKAEMKKVVLGYIAPGYAKWCEWMGYQVHPGPSSWKLGKLSDSAGKAYEVHWTVFAAQFGDLKALRTDLKPFDHIVDAVVPDGAGSDGVHVTLERYGSNNTENPKVFGRPGAHRYFKSTNLPTGITQVQLEQKLDAENARLRQKLEEKVDLRNDNVRAGWEAH